MRACCILKENLKNEYLTKSLLTYTRLGDSYMSAWTDKLKGGLADKKKPSDFDKKKLATGTKHEMEHTDDPHYAKEIAMDHESEDPDYYEKLKKIEKEAYEQNEEEEVNVSAKNVHIDLEPHVHSDKYESREIGKYTPTLKEFFSVPGVTLSEVAPKQGELDLGDDKTSHSVAGAKAGAARASSMPMRKTTAKDVARKSQQRNAAASKKGKNDNDLKQKNLPGMKDVYSTKPPPKPGSLPASQDGRKPLDQVKGQYLHVGQSNGLSPYFIQQTGHTYQSIPSDMLKGTKIDNNKSAEWGSSVFKIGDDGQLELANSNWDSSD